MQASGQEIKGVKFHVAQTRPDDTTCHDVLGGGRCLLARGNAARLEGRDAAALRVPQSAPEGLKGHTWCAACEDHADDRSSGLAQATQWKTRLIYTYTCTLNTSTD